jgi:hypothetical protein
MELVVRNIFVSEPATSFSLFSRSAKFFLNLIEHGSGWTGE